MEQTETLKEASATGGGPTQETCPRCGEPAGPLSAVPTATLGGRPVTRCPRCGTRSAPGDGPREMVFTCESCGLPFLAGEILPHAEQRCVDCRQGFVPVELPDAAVTAATESEIRAALAGRWKLVASPALGAYLDRIARQIAQRIERAPEGAHVVLVDEPGLKTLALPSGAILVSLDTLAFLDDEAELAFVLGHETAHAASEDAAVRLVRLGFKALSRGGAAHDGDAWAGAALDLVRLGYGRRRERDADLRALEAMLSLGYDPRSVLQYLSRLRVRIEQGDPSVAELASAHPPPDDRSRRIEKALFGRIRDEGVLRVNREVYRRAAGREVIGGAMVPASFGHAGTLSPRSAKRRRRWVGFAVAAAAAAVLAAIGVALLLAR
jgi:predicted Zn-dependent protease